MRVKRAALPNLHHAPVNGGDGVEQRQRREIDGGGRGERSVREPGSHLKLPPVGGPGILHYPPPLSWFFFSLTSIVVFCCFSTPAAGLLAPPASAPYWISVGILLFSLNRQMRLQPNQRGVSPGEGGGGKVRRGGAEAIGSLGGNKGSPPLQMSGAAKCPWGRLLISIWPPVGADCASDAETERPPLRDPLICDKR